MLTLEKLNAFGADTADGLARCMGSEELYLMLAKSAAEDGNFEKLASSLEAGDYRAAFEAAHALKGVAANLSLTPLLKPVAEITELLRAQTDTDCTALKEEILNKRDMLKSICE